MPNRKELTKRRTDKNIPGKQQVNKGKRPTEESLRVFIEREWADLHHSRIQEWTGLGVVTGSHIGILQLLILLNELKKNIPYSIKTIGIIGAGIAIVFVVLGVILICRHRQLMRVKFNWIYKAEDQLGLVRTTSSPHGIYPPNVLMPLSKYVPEKIESTLFAEKILARIVDPADRKIVTEFYTAKDRSDFFTLNKEKLNELVRVKLAGIFDAIGYKQKQLSLPRLFSTGWIMLWFYIALFVIDALSIIAFALLS